LRFTFVEVPDHFRIFCEYGEFYSASSMLKCARLLKMSQAELSLRRRFTMIGTILLVVLVLLLLGALPTWPHSQKWGYYPSGGIGLILLILVILLLLGRL
jgi:hypothetical protein